MADASRWASLGRRVVAVLLRTLFAVVALVTAAFLALLVFVRTSYGRDAVRGRVEAAVSGAMAGSLTIAELTNVWPGALRARGIVFRDPEGRSVLEVERAAIHLEPMKLLRRRLVFREARLRGAVISLASRGGKLGIERAFGAEQDAGAKKNGDLEVQLDGMHVTDARLEMHLADAPRIVLDEVEGFVALQHEPGGGVRIRLDRVSGKVAKASPDIDLRFADLHGAIRSKAREVVDLEFGGSIEGDAMRGAFRYAPHEEPSVSIALDVPDPSFRSAMISLGLGAAGRFSSSIRVERSLGGREHETK